MSNVEKYCYRCKEAYKKLYKKDNQGTGRFICVDCNTKQCKKYRKTGIGKEKYLNAVRRSDKKYPEKVTARVKVRDALKSGKLTKMSCFCGEEESQAHHDDYSKPLDVIWLCRRHHKEIHC
jgi:hypothetical protein